MREPTIETYGQREAIRLNRAGILELQDMRESQWANGFMITFDIDSKTAPPAPGEHSGM